VVNRDDDRRRVGQFHKLANHSFARNFVCHQNALDTVTHQCFRLPEPDDFVTGETLAVDGGMAMRMV
jgi:hypothetical protein